MSLKTWGPFSLTRQPSSKSLDSEDEASVSDLKNVHGEGTGVSEEGGLRECLFVVQWKFNRRFYIYVCLGHGKRFLSICMWRVKTAWTKTPSILFPLFPVNWHQFVWKVSHLEYSQNFAILSITELIVDFWVLKHSEIQPQVQLKWPWCQFS